MEVEDELSMLTAVIGRIEKEEAVEKSLKAVGVAEVYSPPRVALEAKKYGLTVGKSMDLTTGWDFTIETHRDAANEYIERVKPQLVIGSPECRMFRSLQNRRPG